jgi:tRNA(Ile)-lysidine synthase
MPRLPQLVEKVRLWLRRWGVLADGMVVAVSGGSDSLALLYALVNLRSAAATSASAPLILAHLNHRLRGAESDADERFVRDLYARLVAQGASGVQLSCRSLDVAGQARAERGNLEGVARRSRYDFLAQVARQAGVPLVATGHTADDQAETVMHHFLRGTGLHGLRGIAARRSLVPGVEVVRPLLTVTRKEVLAYLETAGLAYRHDTTNDDVRYTRNRIRHQLLPQLAADFNPAIVTLLGRLSGQARELYAEEARAAAEVVKQVERPRAGKWLILDRPRLAAASRHRIRSVLHHLWRREGWPMGRMGYREWERLAELVVGQRSVVQAPGGITVRAVGQVVRIQPDR